jgi:hypothetical protein
MMIIIVKMNTHLKMEHRMVRSKDYQFNGLGTITVLFMILD